jgi:hypothetical protein
MTISRVKIRNGRTIQATVAMAAFVSVLLTAGSNSTTLPNGAELAVSIDSPVTSTEFEVPPGQPSISVPVSGTASVGLGEPDATFVYVMDVSGSTGIGSGTGCAPVLDCEQKFLNALNQAVIDSGSADEVGLAVFADTAAAADVSPAAGEQLLVAPDAPGSAPFHISTVINSTFSVFGGNGGVAQFTNKVVGNATNCTAGLQAALPIVQASSNSNQIAVFVSDGQCDNSGGGGLAAFNAAIAALASEGAVVHTIAAGATSSCTGSVVPGMTLEAIALGTGGMCHHVVDPGALPDLIPLLIGTSLDSLTLRVDGNAPTPIPNSDISLPLPQPGAVSVDYTTPATGLTPGDHTLCVRAFGSDVTGGSASVEQCETIHLLQLSAAPPVETNELGIDNAHTVTATIAGDPAQVGGRAVTFVVSGQNAGATGTCSPNADCTTDAGGQVSFTYTVPIAPASLGVDTITVSTPIGGNISSVQVAKRWVDTTPPVTSCPPTVNPAGKTVPPAGEKSPGQNEDGFYQLVAIDAVDPNPRIFVVDSATGTVFGPYSSGTNIKYVQAPGVTPSATPMAGVVAWLIKGQGDMEIYAVDGSGNQSANLSCLVPPPPK